MMTERLNHSRIKSNERRWLRIIGRGGMLLGAVQFAVGGAALRVDAAHNVFGDSLAYELKDRASAAHNTITPKQARRRLRLAGYVLCASSLFGVGEAALDISSRTLHKAAPIESYLALGSMAYGAIAANKLHGHKTTDLAHRHGLRHAASDIIASGVVLAATVGSHHFGYADAAGALLAAGVTIGFNYPTNVRLKDEHTDV